MITEDKEKLLSTINDIVDIAISDLEQRMIDYLKGSAKTIAIGIKNAIEEEELLQESETITDDNKAILPKFFIDYIEDLAKFMELKRTDPEFVFYFLNAIMNDSVPEEVIDYVYENKAEVLKLVNGYTVKKRYQVQWKNHQTDQHRKHGIYYTHEEAFQSIREWWKMNEFSPLYVRMWTDSDTGITTIDYGDHYMFYYIVEVAN